MTKLLYQEDSYLKEFSAFVERVDEEKQAILLTETAFYPGGGGQPQDTGLLSFESHSSRLLKIKRIEGELWHFLAGPLPRAGRQVHGSIDWERRYNLMRTHTAMHILCGVIWRDYRAQVTGGNMEPLSGRMDFEFENLTRELVSEIESKVNQEVRRGRDIQVRMLPREEAERIPDLIRTKVNLLPPTLTEIRIVEIKGLDLQADGGTHVSNTKEVGNIKITDYKSKGRINKRIKIEVS